ncbi:MAG TPA: hypothetical protein PKA06_10720, partial [Gemmatales bacterium]|nr:hypothetical protein [Gemmatales bacterium]
MKMVTVLVSLIFLNVAALADESNTWQEKLETAITEGIKLLEGKEYVKFLKAFVEPPELEELSKGGSIEEFAEKFAVSKGPQLLSVLKNI